MWHEFAFKVQVTQLYFTIVRGVYTVYVCSELYRKNSVLSCALFLLCTLTHPCQVRLAKAIFS